jgi:hypothetical protein
VNSRRWSGNPRHPVLPPRRQPVPMDQARFVDAVFDANAKGLAHLGRDAKGPVWLPDAIDRRRLAVDLDVAALKPQDRRRRSGAVGRVLRPGETGRRGQGGNAACKKRASGQHGKPHQESADGHYQQSIPSGTCSDRRLPANDGRADDAGSTCSPGGSARRRRLNGVRGVGRAWFTHAKSPCGD